MDLKNPNKYNKKALQHNIRRNTITKHLYKVITSKYKDLKYFTEEAVLISSGI